MKKTVAMCLVLAGLTLAAGVAHADEWINLFDNETLFGWTSIGDGQWAVADKDIVCNGGTGGWLASNSQFADFELVVKMRVEADGSAGLVLRSAFDGHPSENGASSVILSEPKGGSPDWREITVIANGDKITAKIDGKDVEVLGGGAKRGHIGFLYHREGKVEIASAKLRPLNAKPIFNGKDLDGWNIIPDHKSEFKVVDGAINITNGNGQIETAGTYKDFVLQVDVFSNGDHLNSGVFFRGPVGVFWKGYECQVRNEWTDDDRTKAKDFGTGGNYGNQPARKVVSSDREWFTLTIVCEGNHASVWNNGYLVSDYFDDRPIATDSNGKSGFVPGPGTIHLQGHDPTTNLSFKNIQLSEIPAK
jgi:hypothetical protein